MRTKLFTIILAFIGINAFAQITVTDNDIIDVGDNIYEAVDSLPSNSITIGNSGASQTWDFSSLQVMEVDTIEVISPVGTPYESIHPNANMCVEIDDELMYLDKSSTGLEMVGYGDVPFNALIIPLPLNYGLSQQTGLNTVMDSSLQNMFFPDSLAPFISSNPLDDKIDSLKIFVVQSSNFNVDAWGDVTIPMGTYSSLRLNVEETTITDLYAYCSSSLTTSGSWYPVPPLLFPTETETVNRYQWWSNDPSVKFMLAELEMDSLNNNVEFVTFLTIPQVTAVSNLQSNKINVYPNPTSKDLMITTNLINCSYNLIDVKGSKLLCNAFNNSTIIDLSSYSSGTYFLQIYTEEGDVITKKVVVE
jgi:hypothetical protein